jgi:hypothetical protein
VDLTNIGGGTNICTMYTALHSTPGATVAAVIAKVAMHLNSEGWVAAGEDLLLPAGVHVLVQRRARRPDKHRQPAEHFWGCLVFLNL